MGKVLGKENYILKTEDQFEQILKWNKENTRINIEILSPFNLVENTNNLKEDDENQTLCYFISN